MMAAHLFFNLSKKVIGECANAYDNGINKKNIHPDGGSFDVLRPTVNIVFVSC